MSESSPDDLAIAFRSLARRRREAIGDANPRSVSGLVAELQGHVDAAAGLLGAPADAAAVATAIDDRPAEAWDVPTLDTLRRHALDAGSVLRRIVAAVEAESDDG